MEIAPRIVRSKSGNSSRATSEALYTDAPDSLTESTTTSLILASLSTPRTKVSVSLPPVPLPTAIAWFCHATKVWQMPAWWDVFQAHEEGTMPTGTRAARWSAEMRDAADDDAALAELRDQVLDELSSDGRLTAQQLAVFRTRYESGRFENEDIVLLLLLCSRLPACDVGRPDSLPSVPRRFVDGSTLLLPPVCAYDYHTAVGKARMRAWLAAHPDSGFGFGVDTTPVDLRWAGGLAPLFWRVQAWRQFGSTAGMDATAWHELGVDAEALQRFAAWCGWWPENMVA